jgi:hypothetical protein
MLDCAIVAFLMVVGPLVEEEAAVSCHLHLLSSKN